MFNVTLSTGQLCHFGLDFSFPGFIPVEFDRFYQSQLEYEGPLGHGWTFPYQGYLEVQEDRFIFFENVYAPTPYEFSNIADDGVYGESSTRIVRVGDSVVLQRPEVAYHFSPVAEPRRLLMTRQVDACGNGLSFDFDGRSRLRVLHDTMGRQFHFSYDINGHIDEIARLHRDGDGRKTLLPLVKYEYDTKGRLVTVIDPLGQSSRYEYDNYLMVAYTNRNGGRYLAQYDQRGRCSHTWRDDGRLFREYRYDERARQTTVTDSYGHQTVHRFNDTGLTIEEVDHRGQETRYVYDQAGKLITSTDEAGATALTMFDERPNEFTIANRTGSVLKLQLLPEQLAREITDVAGGVWRYEYDATGRLNRFISPSGAAWTYQYDSRGALIAQTSPIGRTVRYVFDENYTVRTTRDELGFLEESHYDAYGREIEVRRALERRQAFEYDALGRLTVIQRPNGSTVRIEWDPEGNLRSVTEGDGATLRLVYSAFNQLEAIVDVLGERRRYQYDEECYLVRIWDEGDSELELQHDETGRVSRQTFPDGRVENYYYDGAGQLTTVLNRVGRPREFQLDPDGRVMRVVDGEGKVSEYSYNPNGTLAAAQCGDVQLAFEYDSDGRLIAETQAAETLRHSYDAAGNRISTKLPTGTEIVYRYDSRNRVIAMQTPERRLHEFRYDERDRITGWFLPWAGTTVEYSYHEFDRPKSLRVTGTTRLTRDYEYDERGRLSRLREGSEDTQIVYSVRDEVTELRTNGTFRETYRYDQSGNVIAADGRDFAIDAGNRLHDSGDRRYEYDEAGRIATWDDKEGRTLLTYDGLDRLIRVDHPTGKTTVYSYDPLGRRLSKVHDGIETRYLWQMDTPVMEWTLGEARRLVYLRFPAKPTVWGIVDGHSDYALIGDLLGFPPTHLLDETGTTVWSARYKLWGDVKETTGNEISSQIRYPGQYHDMETGLHYNHHRYYEPSTGRFITPDPIGINGGQFNLYLYAPNPLGYVDPLGLALTTVQCSAHCAANPCKKTKQSTNVPNQITSPCNQSRGSSIHNACINQAWDKAKQLDPNARRDQGQVAGTGIGSNRPDISFTPPGGPQTFVEFDNPPGSRVGQHVSDVCGNNPSAQVMLVAIPATSRFTTPGSATSGSIPRNTAGRPTEAECGW